MRSPCPIAFFWAMSLLPFVAKGFQSRTLGQFSKASLTCRYMLENNIHEDPDSLFEMVQELAGTEEFTPESMERMEELQIALANLVEEASETLMEQESQLALGPKPPSIPPPGSLLGMEDQESYQQRDLASDLTKASAALELLQERLRMEEQALNNAMLPNYFEETPTFEDMDDSDFVLEEQDILFQAEEALRKSREAAERRRLEAEERSLNAARLSAGYREEQEEKKEADFDFFQDEDESNIPQQNVPRAQKRPTMELASLFGTPPPTSTSTSSPSGVPVIYNWIQNDDGSISGNIRGSPNFRDGAKISTSSVLEQARGGTIVATVSGSRYFLEDEEFYQEEETTPQAPEGVPTVKSWEVRNGGGIIGLIYNSPYADDGDYIETSPIVEGDIDNFSVVCTESGSQYFLSGDPPEDNTDNLSNFQQIPRKFGTITLPKGIPRSVRSTFSLMDLFEDDEPSQQAMYLRDGPPRPLPPPTADKVPPEGTPALTGCVFNDNGTITGYVFGSPKIGDGVLITTSPIVEGEKEQFETVVTASGSMYYLG